jgi:transposase
MARPTKYTEERATKILQAIKLGATYRLACMYAGISEDTFARWRTKADFADKLLEAEGSASVQWLAKIEAAASEGTWQAAAWKLERRYPQEYGRKVTEMQGTDGAPLVFTMALDKAGSDDGDEDT